MCTSTKNICLLYLTHFTQFSTFVASSFFESIFLMTSIAHYDVRVLRKRLLFCWAYLFIFGRSYFVRALVYKIRKRTENRFNFISPKKKYKRFNSFTLLSTSRQSGCDQVQNILSSMGNIILEFVRLNFLHSDIAMRKMRIPIFKQNIQSRKYSKKKKKSSKAITHWF